MSIPLASSRLSSKTRPTSWLTPASRLPTKAPAAPVPRSSRLPTPLLASQSDLSKGKGRATVPSLARQSLLERWRASSAERNRALGPSLSSNVTKPSVPTAYFSANRTSLDNKIPQASTSAPHPFQDFVQNGILPQTSTRLEQLIETAFQKEREDVLENILNAYRREGQSDSMEIQALVRVLGLQIQRPYHAHLEKMNRRTRRTLGRAGLEKGTSALSQGLFFNAWQRLWEIQGEELEIGADLAGHILEIAIALPLEAGSFLAGDSAFGTRALRHLLFLAGIEENHSLALDLLAHTIAPHAFSAEPHAPSIPKRQSTASVDEAVLILQDLLRSGVIRSETVQEFDLSSVVSKSLELHSDRFTTLLHQVLLRILVRCYAESYLHDRSTLLLRYLETIEGDTAVDREKDKHLTSSVCEAALRASEIDGRWVGRVAVLITLALQDKLSFWSIEDVLPRLLEHFFDTALPTKRREHPSIRSKYTSAALVWKALEQSGTGTASLPLKHLTEILRSFSQPLHKHSQQTLRDHFPDYSEGSDIRVTDFLKLARRVREHIKSGPEGQVTSVEANSILRTLLGSKTISPASSEGQKLETSILRITEQIYQLFTTSPFITSDPFILETRNLVPLVKTIIRLPDPNERSDHGTSRIEEAGNAIRSFLREKKSRHGQIQPIELTTAARGFFLIGDREAGIAVLGQLLKNRRVPDPVDIRILLVDLAQKDPELALAILGEAVEMGFFPDQDTFWAILSALERNQPDYLGGFVEFIKLQQDTIKNGKQLARQMRDYVERLQTGGNMAETVARASEVMRRLKEEGATAADDSLVKGEATATILQLLKHRRYSIIEDVVDEALPLELVSPEVIQAFLDAIPSRPNKAARRKLAKSGRRALLLPLIRALQAEPAILRQKRHSGTIYSVMRRACLFFEDAEAAKIVWQAGQDLGGMVLSTEDLEVFREVLSGKTESERRKYGFGDELGELGTSRLASQVEQ